MYQLSLQFNSRQDFFKALLMALEQKEFYGLQTTVTDSSTEYIFERSNHLRIRDRSMWLSVLKEQAERTDDYMTKEMALLWSKCLDHVVLKFRIAERDYFNQKLEGIKVQFIFNSKKYAAVFKMKVNAR